MPQSVRPAFATVPCVALLFFCAVLLLNAANAQRPSSPPVLAFPGATGDGSMARGGRGGRVIEVTNLQDSGPGSFRAAVENAGGPRMVVFRISGVITLASPVVITHPRVAVAGATAPGDGICIRGNAVIINASEVVIRDLRFQRGESPGAFENVFVHPELPADDRAACNSIPAPLDSDHDGMPDAWERAHGFNPNDPADGSADADRDGYTNLEEYLNGAEPRKNARAGSASTAGAKERLAAALARHVAYFNAAEPATVINLVPNSESLAWLEKNIPLFECPDAEIEEIYYFRWWALRKHLRRDKATGRLVFTEFINKERPVSSAIGLHIAEMRWLRDQAAPDDYVLYWLRGNNSAPQDFLHRFSNWLPHALLERAHVTGDTAGLVGILDDLVAEHRKWERELQLPDGLFWQFDVRDAMEESISGSRTEKNIRPTINSYMFANARAVAAIARLAGRHDLAAEFDEKAAALKQLAIAALWDNDAKFFKVRLAATEKFSDVREAIGFIPWQFSMPDIDRGYEEAWRQLNDPDGFRAPMGITTAERRHPLFRSHGIGTCEWDGALWPYTTSQTLMALASVIRDYPQKIVAKKDYHDAFLSYTRQHRFGARPYLGEYLDEVTGIWLKGDNPRSSWYNHSTYADLLISGIVGIRPRADNRLALEPLLPENTWAWFCLDGVKYHGRTLTILWDKDGTRYNRGAGIRVFSDGREIASSPKLDRIFCELP